MSQRCSTVSDTNTFCVLSGIVNISFPLSDQPVFGEWFIFVEVQGHTYNKSFEVQKYGEALHLPDSLKTLFIRSLVSFLLLKVNLYLMSQRKYLPHMCLRNVSFQSLL